MVLDFLTLYIVILMNALTMAIIWFLIWWSYRGFGAARTWMAACLVTALGGLVLSMEAARRELGYEPVGTHRATIGAAIDWMLEAVGDADWRERFPALSNRYGAASWFDYDAEDQALAR